MLHLFLFLVAILPIPDVNTTRIPDANITLHAEVARHCCCRQGYDSCYADLDPPELDAINWHDDCSNQSSSIWNAWFSIPRMNIVEDVVVVKITITPVSNESVHHYQSSVVIRLQGIVVHVCFLCCISFATLLCEDFAPKTTHKEQLRCTLPSIKVVLVVTLGLYV